MALAAAGASTSRYTARLFLIGAMKIFLDVMFGVAVAGSVTSSIYCAMVLAAVVRFGLRKRREQRVVPDFLRQ